MTKQTITIEAADPPEGLEYTGEYRRAEKGEQSILNGYHYAGPTCGYALILRKIEPLWVPPKGVFKPGWLTRNDGSSNFRWNQKDPEYEADEGVWVTKGDSMRLFAIHPDSLPPLTTPAHLSKFRVGDDT